MTVLTTAQQIRLRIQDQPLIFDRDSDGDGSASAFPLPYRNITSASAFVMITTPTTGWSATGATFDPTGGVTFAGVISANSAYKVRGVYSVFSDDEIDTFSAQGGGSVIGAAREAVHTLMFDAIKRAIWTAADGSSFDDTAAMAHLREMDKKLDEEFSQLTINDGSQISWALNQENY